MTPHPHMLALFLTLTGVAGAAGGQTATIHESTRTILTYPFSEPDRVPILVKDTRLYPYHAFDGYAHKPIPRPWKVVTLENELISVDILPEVGGKVWGATVKRTGRDFIYRNDVLKFRNIALRGPWTSGGVEFNFGVVGHTPSTATPVDYVTRQNEDGSVSCIVGMMDLPSRTEWRVEIRLEPGRAAFETNVTWSNPTTFEQPYYNWMTAAAPARDDLTMTIPGNTFLGHPGDAHPWPIDSVGRNLAHYPENRFGGNKSYHVVGELADYFGGYYADSSNGFGHWAPAVDMPGQKLWLWALSREGGIWEDLLTDHAGQYVEYQAGRMLVQYTPTTAVTPISQVGFDPGRTDAWSESWFPLEGTGGLTAASRRGVLHAEVEGGVLWMAVTALEAATDTLIVETASGRRATIPIDLDPLVPFTHVEIWKPDSAFRIFLPRLGIDYRSDPSTRTLQRPWQTDTLARPSIPATDRLADSARQLALGRHYPEARGAYAKALAISPWHRASLLGMAELERRRGKYDEGLALAKRALQLDTYDPEANVVAANLYRALNVRADAIIAYGFAARSPMYRVVANIALAEMALASGDEEGVRRYTDRALANDRDNLPARELLAMLARQQHDTATAHRLAREMLAIDPLHHFVAAERFLDAPTEAGARLLREGIRGEFPDQVILELAIGYARRGARDDAILVLNAASGPMARAWHAWLPSLHARLDGPAELDLAFPYRPETLPVLRWVTTQNPHWSWRYLLALNLWALDRTDEAAEVMTSLDGIDHAPALAARALLLQAERGTDPVPDLTRAVALDPRDRSLVVRLVDALERAGAWRAADSTARVGLTRFRDDFTLQLLRATALLQLGRGGDAAAILDRVQVLPSEHARESHHLFVQAHSMVALDALARGDTKRAARELQLALIWPENLGQGKPYQPDERLVRYLQAVVAVRSGDPTAVSMPAPTFTNVNVIDARLMQRARELTP
ncbi:MAG TPA: DUF5107 domain-containing protein [Gemmatimonadales bacterium]|nr:DUF5107 domain-containing protein [Gemmatimonadales bacterium]